MTAHVPDVQVVAVVLQSLNVEPQGGRNGGDVLAVELFQNCCLAGIVQASVKREIKQAKFQRLC